MPKPSTQSTSEEIEIADGPNVGEVHMVKSGTNELRLAKFAPENSAGNLYHRTDEMRRGRVRFKVVK